MKPPKEKALEDALEKRENIRLLKFRIRISDQLAITFQGINMNVLK
jgi:hypothetical protein